VLPRNTELRKISEQIFWPSIPNKNIPRIGLFLPVRFELLYFLGLPRKDLKFALLGLKSFFLDDSVCRRLARVSRREGRRQEGKRQRAGGQEGRMRWQGWEGLRRTFLPQSFKSKTISTLALCSWSG
jgi:hypothetical protein